LNRKPEYISAQHYILLLHYTALRFLILLSVKAFIIYRRLMIMFLSRLKPRCTVGWRGKERLFLLCEKDIRRGMANETF